MTTVHRLRAVDSLFVKKDLSGYTSGQEGRELVRHSFNDGPPSVSWTFQNDTSAIRIVAAMPTCLRPSQKSIRSQIKPRIESPVWRNRSSRLPGEVDVRATHSSCSRSRYTGVQAAVRPPCNAGGSQGGNSGSCEPPKPIKSSGRSLTAARARLRAGRADLVGGTTGAVGDPPHATPFARSAPIRAANDPHRHGLSPLFQTPLRTSHRPYRDGDRLRREARRSHLMHAVWSIARARYPGRARRRGRQRRERKRNCGQPSRRTRRNRLLMGSNANVLGTREAGRPRQDRSTNRRPGDPGQRPSGANLGDVRHLRTRYRVHQQFVTSIKRDNPTSRSRGDDDDPPPPVSGPRRVSLSGTSGLLREVCAPSLDAGSCLDRHNSSCGRTPEHRKAREHGSTIHDWLIDRRWVVFLEWQRPGDRPLNTSSA